MSAAEEAIVAPMSNPATIAYNSDARTDLVTLLHLLDDQWTTFPLAMTISSSTRSSLASMMTKPICEDRSSLFANAASTKIRSFAFAKLMG